MKLPKNDGDLTDDKFEDEDRVSLVATNIGQPNEPPKIPNPVIDCCLTAVASIRFLWIFRRMECLLAVALIFFTTVFVMGIYETYEKNHHDYRKHMFKHTYVDIKSALELRLGDIDHWCFNGGDDSCPQCDDPTQPISRGESDEWRKAFMRNVKFSKEYTRNDKHPDVVFLGDALVESTMGTYTGLEAAEKSALLAAKQLDEVKSLYDQKFQGKYDVLRLGIAGDTSPNLFWRLRQYEIAGVRPKIWWIAVGRDDLYRTKCSEEVALMGVLRVVEELINRQDGATIVINSLLPIARNNKLQLEGKRFKNEMYTSVAEVNRRLKNFAKKHHHVVFFDADDIFVQQKGNSKYISDGMYFDKYYPYPSIKGFKELVNSQIQFIDAIMEKKKAIEEQGGLSPKTSPTTSSDSTGSNAALSNTEKEKEAYVDGALDAEGMEYTNFDDYYGYETLFEDEDDFLSGFTLYGDDFMDMDDDW